MENLAQDRCPIAGSDFGLRPGSTRLGSVDPAELIDVAVVVRRDPTGPPMPDPLLGGAFVGRADFARLYGASVDDLDRVAQVGQTFGLLEQQRSSATRILVLRGSTPSVEAAFGVVLSLYQHETGTYRGHEGPITVPKQLGDIVEGVFGLDNRPMSSGRSALKPAPPSGGGTSATTVTPPQVAALYGYPTPNAGGYFASVGIIDFCGGFLESDINAYAVSLGQTPVTFNDVGPSTTVWTVLVPAGNDSLFTEIGEVLTPCGETTLDVDVVSTVVPGIRAALYVAPDTMLGWISAIATAVHDAVNSPTVLSISYGWPEDEAVSSQLDWTPVAMSLMNAFFLDAAVMGLTVFAASGDLGSGSRYSITDKQARVNYPASDPLVTAVGGTALSHIDGTSFEERPWSSPQGGATGGGVSAYNPVPAWQTGAGVPQSVNPGGGTGRGVPDIAGNAADASPYALVFEGKNPYPTWGTSAAAPLYAALLATFNPDNQIQDQPSPLLGLLNPTLYSPVARSAFNNVYQPGFTNAYFDAPGYPATPGWNACCGWGSINVDRFRGLYIAPGVGAASQRYGVPNQTDVYVVNSSGTLLAFSVVANSDWVGPQELSAPKFAPPGSGVAVVEQAGVGERTGVFVVGSNGAVDMFWSDSGGPWNGPQPLSTPGFAPPRIVCCCYPACRSPRPDRRPGRRIRRRTPLLQLDGRWRVAGT